MEQLVKRLVLKLFPELEKQLHLVQLAVVTAIPAAVSQGDQATDFEPRYAVNIRMLDANQRASGPIYESVPLPQPMAGEGRGVMGFPPPGTIVSVQFAYGDPERPLITNIYPSGLQLPRLGTQETLLQHSPATYLRSTQQEDWELVARNKMWLGNGSVDVVTELHALAAEVEKLASIQKGHTHPGVGPNTQGGNVAQVESAAAKVKGRVATLKQ